MYFVEIKLAVNQWVKPSAISEDFAIFDKGYITFEDASCVKGKIKGAFKSKASLKKMPVRVVQRSN